MRRRRGQQVDPATATAKKQADAVRSSHLTRGAEESERLTEEIASVRSDLTDEIERAFDAWEAGGHQGVVLVTYLRRKAFGRFEDVELGAVPLFSTPVPFYETTVDRTIYLTGNCMIASGVRGQVHLVTVDDICSSLTEPKNAFWNRERVSRLLNALRAIGR